MRDHDLSELFGVFRGLGLEKREQPPVPRVPEKQALIWFDVKSCWAKPEWKKLAFLIGLTHSYPRGTSIHAAIWQAQVGPWFDAWIARAKAAPMTMLAERRSDGSGVVVWREPPTRASVFARLGEFNESEAKWRAVQPQGGAPQARPTPAQLVAGMTDPAKAWHALVSAGLVPPAWANEPRRRFQHADRWESFPRTVADCATIAEQLPAMARYEALAFDLFGRTAWWQMPPSPSVARWAVYGPMPPGSGPMVPPLLQGIWSALAMAVPDAGMHAYTDTTPVPGWAERGAWAWAAAVSRGVRIPAGYGIAPHLAGRAFAEMGDPFAAAREIEAMPYRLAALDAAGMTFWAYGSRP